MTYEFFSASFLVFAFYFIEEIELFFVFSFSLLSLTSGSSFEIGLFSFDFTGVSINLDLILGRMLLCSSLLTTAYDFFV